MSNLEIRSLSQSIADGRCLEVWFAQNVTSEDRALLLKAVNTVSSHDALVRAAELQEAAELFHANCEECDGEEVPELCEKCFPLYDDARIARRGALALVGQKEGCSE